MNFILRAIKKKDISLKVEDTFKLKNINSPNGVFYIEKLDHLDYKEEKIVEGTKGYILGDVINYSSKDPTKHKGFFYIIKWYQIAKTIEFHSDYQSF